MPSFSIILAMYCPLDAVLYTIESADSSACLSASLVVMSGAVALVRTSTPAPTRPSATRPSATTLPAFVCSSSRAGSATSTSALSPSASFLASCGAVLNWILTSVPLVLLNASTARTSPGSTAPGESNLISAAAALADHAATTQVAMTNDFMGRSRGYETVAAYSGFEGGPEYGEGGGRSAVALPASW